MGRLIEKFLRQLQQDATQLRRESKNNGFCSCPHNNCKIHRSK